MRLRIDFHPIDANTLEIHSNGKSARTIPIAEFQALASHKLDADPAELIDLGKRLYQVLDGPERRLASLTPNATLELGFADRNPPVLLTHLPWELLHDGAGFLVQQGVIPVRVIGANSAIAEPANRPLNVLFMACSSRNVQPLLDFEAEERIIMDATARQPLYPTPEETGRAQQGEVEGALALYRQSLEIYERIGAAKGKAATLHEMAGCGRSRGSPRRRRDTPNRLPKHWRGFMRGRT